MSAEPSIVERLREYEETHDVSSYTVEGVNMWPFLRTWTAWRKMNKVGALSVRRNRRVEAALAKLQRYSKLLMGDRAHAQKLRANTGVAAFVTQGNRRQLIRGRYHHPIVDPLCGLCEKQGIVSVVFEGGQARMPRARPSFWSSGSFKRDRWIQRFTGRERDEPEWFGEYQDWAEDWLEREVPWSQWNDHFETLFRRAATYETWFRKVGARVVFVDCWYNDLSMPATLAGHRLGLRVIELQHARQSAGYFGYSGLRTGDEFQLVPKVFWVWGERDREVFLRSNGEGFEVLVGGNSWFNQWRGEGTALFGDELEKTHEVIASAPFSVVVTTQPTVALDRVYEAMDGTPAEWRWLFRVHPSQRSMIEEIESGAKAGHPNVEVRGATSCPLLPLLSLASVHLTGDSTCALEALGMRTPTILFDELGKVNFAEFVQNGTMLFTESSEELRAFLEGICSGTTQFPDLSGVADRVFAPAGATREVLRSLLRSMPVESRN